MDLFYRKVLFKAGIHLANDSGNAVSVYCIYRRADRHLETINNFYQMDKLANILTNNPKMQISVYLTSLWRNSDPFFFTSFLQFGDNLRHSPV